ncbi:MAG: hypothetical protein LUF01_16365, partial [Bacteroides sp.]|nr:hypothetical protein [Bacteroides sp.]
PKRTHPSPQADTLVTPGGHARFLKEKRQYPKAETLISKGRNERVRLVGNCSVLYINKINMGDSVKKKGKR